MVETATMEDWDVNAFFFSTDYTLTPGVWDDDAEYTFTHGHCHAFALALQRILGDGKLIAADWDSHVTLRSVPSHVALAVEIDGQPCDVDAHGLHMLGNDRYRDWREITEEDILRWVEHEEYRPARVDDAEPFAREFLRAEGVI